MDGNNPGFIADQIFKLAKNGGNGKRNEKKKLTIAEARTQAQKAAAVVNQAKWAACHAWCKSQGMGFRVITEHQIFNKPQNSKKKRKKQNFKRISTNIIGKVI